MADNQTATQKQPPTPPKKPEFLSLVMETTVSPVVEPIDSPLAPAAADLPSKERVEIFNDVKPQFAPFPLPPGKEKKAFLSTQPVVNLKVAALPSAVPIPTDTPSYRALQTPSVFIASECKNFTHFIDEYKLQYHSLAVKFNSLSFLARRSVDRRYFEPRFNCVAIFQFLNDASELSAALVESLARKPTRCFELIIDEKVPVAREWYASLFAAEKLVAQLVAAKVTTYTQKFVHSEDEDGPIRTDASTQMHEIKMNLCDAAKRLNLAMDWVAMSMFVEVDHDTYPAINLVVAWEKIVEAMTTDGTETLSKIEEDTLVWLSEKSKQEPFRAQSTTGAWRHWVEWCPKIVV